MPKERLDYKKLVQGLDIAKGDRLIDVLRIWRYRIEHIKEEKSEIVPLAEVLVPKLKDMIEDEQTDIALRGETVITLCSVVTNLSKSVDNKQAKELLDDAYNEVLFSLSLPMIVYGKEIAQQTVRQFDQRP